MEKKKILIVEDEKDMRELLTFRLQTSGYEVLTAADSQVALSEIKHGVFDLIILDLMLPGIGGYELCWKLKTDKEFYQIPVLIFSARAGDIDRTMGLQCGADDYLTKPFDGEVLLKRVEKLLEMHPNAHYN